MFLEQKFGVVRKEKEKNKKRRQVLLYDQRNIHKERILHKWDFANVRLNG